jgi:hypothetical protein
VSYRVNLEPSALRQIGGLPGDVFDMLVNLLVRVSEDPFNPVLSSPTGVPRRRVADLGESGFVVFAVDENAALIRVYDLIWTGA